jgi:predicted FMN-binding regulatory protein PaiB
MRIQIFRCSQIVYTRRFFNKVLAELHALIEKFNNQKPYQISEDYKFKLIRQITGFRMEIIRIEGKFKLGQNRSLEDRRRIKQELSGQPESQMLAELMGVK